jgi:hypothetical protein
MATPITEQPNNLMMGRQNVFVDISVYNMLQMTPFIDIIKIVLSQNCKNI